MPQILPKERRYAHNALADTVSDVGRAAWAAGRIVVIRWMLSTARNSMDHEQTVSYLGSKRALSTVKAGAKLPNIHMDGFQ